MTSWYCILCDRTNIFKNKPKHIDSNFHKHKENYSILVKENEFDNPVIYETFSNIKICARRCANEYFHNFTFKRIYDIEMRNGDIVNGMIFDKNLKNFIRENGFTHKLTIKTQSNLSNINIRFFLNFQIPKMQREFFRIISQNPDHIKSL